MAFFSTNSNDYASAISKLTKPTYQSKYESTIAGIMDTITNRKDFSYDFNADPLYQNYKDQYVKLGNEASMNAVANTSAMTGGFANSYSATASSQANQQYLTQLNEVIPELYNVALNKYNMETENLYNQFDMYSTEENRLYGQYRDSVSDYYNDLSDLRSGYSTALGAEQWEKEYDLSLAQYNSGLDQWQKNYEYQQARDKVSDDQWQKSYELSKYNATKSSGSGDTNKESQYYNKSKVGLSKAYNMVVEGVTNMANNGYSWNEITKYLEGRNTKVNGKVQAINDDEYNYLLEYVYDLMHS